jgi:hypothetical protein
MITLIASNHQSSQNDQRGAEPVLMQAQQALLRGLSQAPRLRLAWVAHNNWFAAAVYP